MRTRQAVGFVWLSAAAVGAGCGGPEAPEGAAEGRKLVIAAYTTPREVLDEHILGAFQAEWLAKTGEAITFETSFQGSGSQARAVAGGLEADVVWLSLAPDVEVLVEAGLIQPGWEAGPTGGMVSSSVVVIGVRPGNPEGIQDWSDLAREGVEVLTPNVRTSGGAMWNVLAVTSAAEHARRQAGGEAGPTGEAALAGVLRNVRVMDKGARESMLSFEQGLGDAIITYENEAVVARRAGREMDYVLPPVTVRIENPAAVVDVYAERRGTTDLAEAFVAFLAQPAQQAAMTRYGLRPVVEGVPSEVALPEPGTVLRVSELGGWAQLKAEVFADGGLYDRALQQAQAGKQP